MEPAAKDPYL